MVPFALLETGNLFFQTIDFSSEGRLGGCLIFIHGAGGSHENWLKQFECKFPGWKLIAVDLPGHGTSEGVPLERIDDYSAVLKEFIERTGLRRPCLLIGHSMGGSIAMQTALSYSGLIGGLVLIGSGARMPVNPQMLEQLSKGNFDTKFLKIALSPDAPADLQQSMLALWANSSQQQLNIDFNACNNFDVSEQLASLNVPVLIVVGSQDKMAPVKSSQFLHQNIVNSQLAIIHGSGHYPMLEMPQETNQAILEFLNESFPG
jgi:pimeloyl-ACP methyl ester carboxylesterase